MNILIMFAVPLAMALLVTYFILVGIRRNSKPQSQTRKTYLGLRNSALKASRAEIGLVHDYSGDLPWGAVMDWGMENGTTTVVAFSDGTASVYLSSGGGSIGGGQSHESTRKAAKDMVTAAVECREKTHATTVCPLPRSGEVFFYLLTDKGVFTASATVKELMSHTHPLSRIGDAAQNVISRYRSVES